MLNKLSPIGTKKKKRLGRGIGSGRGSKSGRGTTRHQNAREKIPLWFEGGQNRLVKRFPLLRGKGKNKSVKQVIEVRSGSLNIFNDGDVVNAATLMAQGLIGKNDGKKDIKIILNGAVEKKLTVEVRTTKGAKDSIEKIGGSVTIS
ncbi:MAG: 50S ribosomal protein L15 [Patescibacteria group bacterium]|nr:50S ribosomal protein L15 [Patescibacteria group bacterium]